MVEDSLMPTPLDPASLPRQVIALRGVLLQREAEHAAEQARQAAELIAARNGLQEQVLRNEQLKRKRPVSPAFLTVRRPAMIGVRRRCADRA